MNWVKANEKVCKALAKRQRVCGHEWEENYFVVTVDGCYAYIFPKKQIHFNLSEIKLLDKSLVSEMKDYTQGYFVKPTRLYLDLDGSFVRKFEGKGYAVWIKSEFLKQFEGGSYYQSSKSDPTKLSVTAVMVFEERDPVGFILPVRVMEDIVNL
jgi:hypothetical protein